MDDADEKVIRRRFDVYQRETAPVLGFYPASVVREVDSVGSPAVILQRILDILAPIQDAHFRNPLAGDPKA
jgi:adenylate kinase